MKEKAGCAICGDFTHFEVCGKCSAKVFQPPKEFDNEISFANKDSKVLGQ